MLYFVVWDCFVKLQTLQTWIWKFQDLFLLWISIILHNYMKKVTFTKRSSLRNFVLYWPWNCRPNRLCRVKFSSEFKSPNWIGYLVTVIETGILVQVCLQIVCILSNFSNIALFVIEGYILSIPRQPM